MTSAAVIKVCSCKRTYTQAQWDALPGLKLWRMPWHEVLEQRDCSCKSSITITLEAGDAE